MWCQIHCLQANVIWNILGWLPRRSFRLKKLPQILINLIKGPFFFTFKLINYRSKTRSEGGGRGFYEQAWTSCKHATKAGKKPSTPALKRESSSSPFYLYTSGPPTRMCRTQCIGDRGVVSVTIRHSSSERESAN